MSDIFTNQALTPSGLFKFRIEPIILFESLFFRSDNIFQVNCEYLGDHYCFHFRLYPIFLRLYIIDKQYSPSEIKNLEQILLDAIYSKKG